MRFSTAATAASLLIAQPAWAGDRVIVQPVQIGSESLRFTHGVASVDNVQRNGAVQVTVLPLDHGNLTLEVAFLNAGAVPMTVDPQQIAAFVGGQRLRLLTTQQLESKAKSRTLWKQIGVVALSAIAASAAANQRDYVSTSYAGQFGRIPIYGRSVTSVPSLYGQLQADRITDQAGYALTAMQDRLDRTREAIGAETLQLSTVDPGQSYGGRVSFARFKPAALPERLSLAINWNGETYQFAFQLARPGTPQPAFASSTTPVHYASTPAMPVMQTASPSAVPIRPLRTEQFAAAPTPVQFAAASPQVETVRVNHRTSAPVARDHQPAVETASSNRYVRTLAAQQGVRRREPVQGWTISD